MKHNCLADTSRIVHAIDEMVTSPYVPTRWYENKLDHYSRPAGLSAACHKGLHRARCAKLSCSCECHKGVEK